MYEIGSYIDEGVKVTMLADAEYSLTHLYEQAVKRLMRGIREDPSYAIQELKEQHPDKVKGVITRLEANYTPEGIEMFEASFRKGFKSISIWQNG